MNVAIFGPPGAGKSALIRILRSTYGQRTFDLERVWPALPSRWYLATFSFLGAAGHQPHDLKESRSVLLLPPRTVYDRRRAIRDRSHPHKSGQADVYDAFADGATAYDYVLKGDETVRQTALHLLFIARDLDTDEDD